MRARHRHFSYKAAGASLALDTRYIHGVSDGTTVQTWSDKSGNSRDAAQATAASRATYKTAIQGGNGVLRFDGGDFYNAPFTTGTAYSLYCVYKRSGSSSNAFNNVTFVASAGIDGDGTSTGRRYQLTYTDTPAFASNTNAVANATMNITRNDNWNIHSVTAPVGSGTARYLLNEASEQTVDVSGAAGITSGTVRMSVAARSWINDFSLIGDMGLLVAYESAHSASLRRRLNHHAAYSFKISCN
jgi:hypothetical protein